MVLKIQNIKEVLDPGAQYVFLDDDGITEALPIGGLEQEAFLVHFPKGKLPAKNRSGYFVASNGKGIVRFKGECQPLRAKEGGALYDLYRLVVQMDTLTLVDRRHFIRYEFGFPLPISFSYEGKFIKAHLINISEGGLRMSVDRRLPTQVIYHFDVQLPFGKGGPFHFETDGLAVYCEPEEEPSFFMTGVTFVAPRFEDESQRKSYQKACRELASLIRENVGMT